MGVNSNIYSATDWAAVTPSDTVAISPPNPRYLWIGGAGNIAVVSKSGSVVTFAVLAGTKLDVQALRVNATNTTATGIVALY